MRVLEGKASDILLDYIEGRYDLIQDQSGNLIFVDENGETFDVTDEVLFYLNLIDDHCIDEVEQNL